MSEISVEIAEHPSPKNMGLQKSDLNKNHSENQRLDVNDSTFRNLMNVEYDRFDISLQRLYSSKNCIVFYVLLLMTCAILVVWTCLNQFMNLKAHSFFIVIEFFVNFTILVDFGFRVRLVVSSLLTSGNEEVFPDVGQPLRRNSDNRLRTLFPPFPLYFWDL